MGLTAYILVSIIILEELCEPVTKRPRGNARQIHNREQGDGKRRRKKIRSEQKHRAQGRYLPPKIGQSVNLPKRPSYFGSKQERTAYPRRPCHKAQIRKYVR